MKAKAQIESFRALVAIDSAFILLDAKDTLLELGVTDVTGVTSAAMALSALRRDPYDVVILGLDSSSSSVDALVDEIEKLGIPTLIVANGIPAIACSRLQTTKPVSVPFDLSSLGLAIEQVVQRGFRRPCGN